MLHHNVCISNYIFIVWHHNMSQYCIMNMRRDIIMALQCQDVRLNLEFAFGEKDYDNITWNGDVRI